MVASRDKDLAEKKELNSEKWKINKNKTKKKQQQENIKDNKTKEKGRKHWKDASYKKPRI